MKKTANKVIEVALNEVGYLEKASNKQLDNKTANAGTKNYTKYARDLDAIPGFYNGKKNGYAWCDIFVDWCFVTAFGVDAAKELLIQPNKSLGAGCEYSANYFKKKKQFHEKDPKPGDQIFFLDKSGKEVCHTGLVYKVDKTKVYTVEGNTSGASGVVANGGGVRKKSYSLNYARIHGYGRPAYDAEEVVEAPEAEKLDVDGVWGVATTKRAQEVFGTTVDGKISNQDKKYAASNPGLSSATFDWESKPTGTSQLIKAIQKKVKVTQTGRINATTIKAMQKWLGTTVDGYVSRPSQMIKAFQKWLNNQ